MNYEHFMVDIETLSTADNATILSIGCVAFNGQGVSPNAFYARINPADAAQYGHIDVNTVMWWMQQPEEARKELYTKSGTVKLEVALQGLLNFIEKTCGSVDRAHVWGNSPSFDCVKLRSAYKAVGLSRKLWKYYSERDMRTMKELFKDVDFKAEDGNVKHNAVQDARNQALHLIKILKEKNIKLN
jgi:DNA polymerase III epsilon subunit-like protein